VVSLLAAQDILTATFASLKLAISERMIPVMEEMRSAKLDFVPISTQDSFKNITVAGAKSS
jgi:hypothetical protein